MAKKSNVVTVRLTDDQLKFFTDWQQSLESELGIDVPLGAVLRRALDGVINDYQKRTQQQPPADPVFTANGSQRVTEFIKNYQEDGNEPQ